MTVLRILSGGAAQGLVGREAPGFETTAGVSAGGEFGAVGLMAGKFRAGDPADILILTDALIQQLGAEGRLVAGSARNIGPVPTAIAVRAGTRRPPIASADDVKAAWLAADALYVPDVETSTAGQHVAKVLRTLGIWDQMAPRLRVFPNGATAMAALAASADAHPVGCTQATEILNTPGLDLVGPLPEGIELAAMYTAAVSASSPLQGPAAALIDRLAASAARASLGFSV